MLDKCKTQCYKKSIENIFKHRLNIKYYTCKRDVIIRFNNVNGVQLLFIEINYKWFRGIKRIGFPLRCRMFSFVYS